MKRWFLFILVVWGSVSGMLAQNMVAYYPFNGNANDESGNNRNPLYNGATLTTDRFGNANSAYLFSGAVNGHIEYSSTGLPETNRTISLWFNASDLNSKPVLFSYGGNGCTTTLIMAINSSASGNYPSPQYLVTGHCNTNNITYMYQTEPVNAWYHWVLTINGSEQKIYINGQLKSTQNTFTGNTYTTDRELAFGVATYISGYAPYTDTNLGYFQGKLDDIRIYNVALSQTEITSIYENESTCEGPLSAVVTSPNNSGAGTLRAAVACLENGGTITWSPAIDRTLLTASLAIDKDINLEGTSPLESPVIIIDLMNTDAGFVFSDGASLNLEDINIQVRNHSNNKPMSIGDGTINIAGVTDVFKDRYPFGSVHCNPAYTTEIVDVVNPLTGRTWMDRNLGASRVAINSTDMQAYGDLYQWGRFSDGHQCRNSDTIHTLSSSDNPGHGLFIINNFAPYDWRSPQNNSLWQIPANLNNPCPVGYRVPTMQEFSDEVATWTGVGAEAAFNSVLKLPLAGGRATANGNLHDTNIAGYYRTNDGSSSESNLLFFFQDIIQIFPLNRGFGASVRCIKE